MNQSVVGAAVADIFQVVWTMSWEENRSGHETE
jgi:hypothetical protein